MKLSILIPAYNEEATISTVLNSLKDLKLKNLEKEIIVIDDGSNDKTSETLKTQKKSIKVITHKINKGKGAAIKSGLKEATGDIVMIQDADLEYNPKDIPRLIKPIIDGKTQVVYGTRLRMKPILFGKNKTPHLLHFFGNKFLSFLTTLLYGQNITDMETGYKIFTKETLKGVRLKSKGFELEPEITAKILKKGYKILELNIKTKPRGYDEGKKIRPIRDGIIALFTLIRYRIVD